MQSEEGGIKNYLTTSVSDACVGVNEHIYVQLSVNRAMQMGNSAHFLWSSNLQKKRNFSILN